MCRALFPDNFSQNYHFYLKSNPNSKMKAVRGVHEHMTKSIGVTTGNHLVADGIQRNYPTGPRLQVAPGEPLPLPRLTAKNELQLYTIPVIVINAEGQTRLPFSRLQPLISEVVTSARSCSSLKRKSAKKNTCGYFENKNYKCLSLLSCIASRGFSMEEN